MPNDRVITRENFLKYMAQPDTDNEICKVCKRIFIKNAL